MTRTEKTLHNVRAAVICQIITLASALLTRRLVVTFTSAAYLGLGGLFSNIMTVLSLAEMGVGTSITFSLYRPLHDGDEDKVAALMRLFKRAYTMIGGAVIVIGAAIIPLLRFFVDDFDKVRAEIPQFYLIYILYVLNAGISYFLSYTRTLIVADQKKYITSIVSSAAQILLLFGAFALFSLTKNYVLFMVLTVCTTLGENVVLSVIAYKKYPALKNRGGELTQDDKKTIKTNVSSSVLHNIGGVLVNGTDNIIISRFVGFIVEGVYSSYHLISAALDSLLRPIFQSATAGYGDLAVEDDGERRVTVFNRMFFAGAWLYGLSAVCIACLSADFVEIWLGDGFEIGDASVLLIALNFYLVGMRRPVLCARDAMGLLRYDRWKSIAEAAINIVLSILLARTMGLSGVLLGTTISCLTTCFWVEPLMLYRHGFSRGVGAYFARYAFYAFATAAAFALCYFTCRAIALSGILGLIVKAAVCLAVSNAVYAAAYARTDEFKYFYNSIKGRFSRKGESAEGGKK